MRRTSGSDGAPVDLICSLVFALAAVAVSVLQVPAAVSVAVALPFLLFVPGYAVTVALFPRRSPGGTAPYDDEHGGLATFERVVLAVATSVALAVVVGVNLDHTAWSIRPPTFVGGLAAVTVVAVGVGFVRRYMFHRGLSSDIDSPSDASARRVPREGRDVSWSLFEDGPTVATVAVAFAVLVSLVSVAMVGGTDQRGERYTEFGLLTENESGELVATGHPSELTVGEPVTLYYTIANEEQRPTDYRVVVQLAVMESDGDVASRTRLKTFDERLAAGESLRREHTVTPTVSGDDLRLTYLLYRTDPPERPTAANAYRDLHVWVDVDSAETVGISSG